MRDANQTISLTSRLLSAALLSTVVFVILSSWILSVRSDPSEPEIVAAIERRFGDFFLFTTKEGVSFEIYQQVQDDVGLPRDPQLVCMFHQCFIKVVTSTGDNLRSYEATAPQAFRAVQDSYRLLRRASLADRASAAEAWRAQLDRLRCTLTKPQC